eukprot:TRINITY_DN10065_c3_g1_i1.p1 TRINITY_DN10065_c3_g1~~TRINITY_DN10065_c3_g1_i1.p1  ORF type:complete len:259 (-),score=58.96 TRINITY_DN10065_c3_g1_i1:266-1042(-)
MGNSACCQTNVADESGEVQGGASSPKPGISDLPVASAASEPKPSQAVAGSAEPEEEEEGDIKRAISALSLHGVTVFQDEAIPVAPIPTSKSTRSLKDGIQQEESFISRTISNLLGATEPEPPNFHGTWECIATREKDLDDFLKAAGVGYIQRCAAAKARWPEWEFAQDKHNIKFTNRTMMGDIFEEFTVGGAEYIAIDGRKQRIKSKAVWEGDTLLIEREGPQGCFFETRRIDEKGELHFCLEAEGTGSWGRTFKRKN